ncbi:MAG: hypothetical protein EON55_08780, partial [Alphaproteobacteria bacterium]
LPLSPRTVIIVENKESAQLVPKRAGLVVIHSLGNHLDALTALPWLQEAEILYWGDLDRTGFTLLSRARALLPGLASVLMDEATFEEHVHLAVPDTTRVDPPRSTLTLMELEALRRVAEVGEDGTGRRLEQERLRADVVVAVLERALEQAP